MAFVIAEPCIGTKDTACVDACPVDCIHPKKNTKYDDARPGFDEVPQLYIDPVECIDCGACVPVCPVAAIFALDDLPEKWKHYTEINASYVQGGKFTQKSMPSTRQRSRRRIRPESLAEPSKPFGGSFCLSYQARSPVAGRPNMNLPLDRVGVTLFSPKATAITLRLVQIASPVQMF